MFTHSNNFPVVFMYVACCYVTDRAQK